ncbi:MAG TPA: GTPase HflX [Candidatus Omnitrophota bacterium]|nr:GTPase HflX [Candidatus Omnitrophota bacterium]HSA31547.1 GTPase HflX [Candidatus Omnitrophota bacterium]
MFHDIRAMNEKERVLVVVVTQKFPNVWTPQDIAQEMRELVLTCGGDVKDTIFCSVEKFSPSHLIGQGKVNEIFVRCAAGDIDTVIMSYDLKGVQQRNLEQDLKVKVIDRTQLILDIFARHASSLEGKMQVELAQLEYALPRLTGHGEEMSRLGGGIGTLGPGETQLETDRRKIGARIITLKEKLAEIVSNRAVKRKKREDSSVPLISLVGYTNAGKSTLLNALTGAHQVTHDGLFTTLDSLARQYTLPNHQKVVLSDTVGFIHQLPHSLIEAFKATLEEVAEADLLLHVLDISNPKSRNLYDAVNEVLKEIGALEKPTITVLNKIDAVEDRGWFEGIYGNIHNPIVISAKTGENLDVLAHKILEDLSYMVAEVDVVLPITRMDLVSLAHREGEVFSIKYYNNEIHLRASLPKRREGLFKKAACRKP